MDVSDFRRFGAAERAVLPVGRAGTSAPSSLSATKVTRLGVPTCEKRGVRREIRNPRRRRRGAHPLGASGMRPSPW
eukprot:10929649-Alexandrium_andersonii.AAC.1